MCELVLKEWRKQRESKNKSREESEIRWNIGRNRGEKRETKQHSKVMKGKVKDEGLHDEISKA